MPVLPFAQRVGRQLVISVALLTGMPATSAAGDAPHTSEVPQPLPEEPRNLYARLAPARLSAELHKRRFRGRDWARHLERVTRGLLGAPYLLSALGEGRGVDVDPRFRLDAFDCTTFVETSLAMARTARLETLPRMLDRIRYTGGRPHFQRRRHLITSQWIPELSAAGVIRDITAEIAGRDFARVHLHLTRGRWANRKVARKLPLKASRIPYGHHELAYLPIELALELQHRIPPATIVNVVRTSRAASPDVVTHQGLVIFHPKKQALMVRHASPVAKRVIDEPLDHMLRRYQKPKKWPILGINLLEVTPPKRIRRDRRHR